MKERNEKSREGKVRLSIIAAVGRKRELGGGNDLLWHIPEDLAHFRALTAGKPVIMGRRTYDSLPEKARPLPGRDNVVILRRRELPNFADRRLPRVFAACSIAQARERAERLAAAGGSEEIFVIGGAAVYEQFLPLAERLYITEIEAEFPAADVFFPPYEELFSQELSSRESGDDRYTYRFRVLERPSAWSR